jgi:hypothetical protein
MELIKFACPQCRAPLPLPVGSFANCRYCHADIAVEDGTKAASRGNATLVNSLKGHSYLVPLFEQFSEAYYVHRDASLVIADANTIETKLLKAYGLSFAKYAVDPSPIDNILSDLFYMVTDVVNDVISSEELSFRDFDNFKRQLFISAGKGMDADVISYQEDADCRISFPDRMKIKYTSEGYGFKFHWTGDALRAQEWNADYQGKYIVTKGLIPTTAYLTRFLFFPIDSKDETAPRLELFKHRAIATKFLLSLLDQVVELRRNWMRENKEIEYLFESVSDLFEPYSEGFFGKKMPDMLEMQNAINEIWRSKFKTIEKLEPVKRFAISL